MKITSPFSSISRSVLCQTFARTASPVAILAALALPVSSLVAGSVTLRSSPGLVTHTGTVNYSAIMASTSGHTPALAGLPDSVNAFPMRHPPITGAGQKVVSHNAATPMADGATQNSTVTPLVRGFTGLRHLDSRTARQGNQFSITPPDQALAVGEDPSTGNRYVLEAVNCVLAVYDTNGDLIVPANASNAQPMALTTFFGLPAALNRSTGAQNADPGDVVALYDPETHRWFVEAWAQDVTTSGAGKNSSKIYLAVSQTSDPTGSWYQYQISFTGVIPDYTKIGLDHYGLYLSSNLYQISDGAYEGVELIAVGKSALESNSSFVPVSEGMLSNGFFGGYEFTLIPQMVPPGTNYVTTNGGTMYFVSSQFLTNTECSLGVWSITSTSNIGGELLLQLARVNTQCFNYPSQAVLQKPGFTPLGTSLGESLETLDPGDFRVGGQNVVFTNSQLFATLATEVTDANNNQVMAAAWFVLHPKFSGGNLSATVSAQGIISLTGASLLRPAFAMNTQLFGALVGTQVGPNNFPSSAIVGFNRFTPGSVQITRAGNEPADDFSGYAAYGGAGTCRWGDYSAGAIDGDNSLWLGTEYTPDINRTLLTNWATYVSRVQLNR